MIDMCQNANLMQLEFGSRNVQTDTDTWNAYISDIMRLRLKPDELLWTNDRHDVILFALTRPVW